MLKAGYACLDITPPLGVQISGYFYTRISDGILDPVYVMALALQQGEDKTVILSSDLAGIRLVYVNKIKAAVAERTGLPKDHVIVAALHQHTSICLDKGANLPMEDDAAESVMLRKFADAAVMALEDMDEAELSAGAALCDPPVAFVRRYFKEDGTVITNPGPDVKIVARCAEADNTARVLRFARQGKQDIALLNFSMHPDTVGGTKFSADWIGYARRYFAADMGALPFFLLGCQGDVNTSDRFVPLEERNQGRTKPEQTAWLGRRVADACILAWNAARPMEEGPLKVQYNRLYNRTNQEGIDKIDEYAAWYQLYIDGKLDPVPPTVDLARGHRIRSLRTSPLFLPVPLTALTMGDLVLFGFGGEAFAAYGAHIRAIAPDKFVICSVITNGYEGYFPTEEAFAQGGYEPAGSFFSPTLEQEIVAAAKEMLA